MAISATCATVKLPVHWKIEAFLLVLAGLAIATVTLPESADVAGGIAMLFGYSGASTMALSRGRRMDGRDRLVWLLIGGGFALAAVGLLLIMVLDVAGVMVPAFGPIDLLFLAGYLGVLGGATLLPSALAGRSDAVRTLIDGVVGAVSIGALIWIFVVGDLVASLAAAGFWHRWAGIAYPLLDIVVVVLVVTLLSRRTRYRMDPRLVFMALGGVFQAFGDLRFLSSGVGSTFEGAVPHYPIMISAVAMFAIAAYRADVRPKPREFAERTVHFLAAAAPYSAALGLVVVTMASLPDAGFDPTTQLLTGATLVVGSLVLARQALAIHDNRIHVDQKRTDLVSSISHELRTPLTAVVGFLDLINDPEIALSGDESAELMTIAQREASRVSRIVADLVLLTRSAPGEMTILAKPTVVSELIDETLHVLGTLDVAISVSSSDRLVALLDRGRLQQVLVNYVENAARYGGGTIEVVACSDHDALVLEVHDNGQGVPKRDHNLIWNRFERGAHRFNAAIPGSGIGLSVVSAIAEAHGGAASYRQSERLGGACFSVAFPGRIIEAEPAGNQAEPVLHYIAGA